MLAEPARMASVTGLLDWWWRHLEVSIPIAAVADAGRCLGWQPRAKVSMMIMRPPQERHGRGSTRGSPAAAVADGSGCFARDGEQLTRPCDVGGAVAVGEQSIVADAVQALGQHVRQKAPNELVGWQCHGLIAIRPLDPVTLPRERDAGLVG